MNTEKRLYQWDTGQKLVGCTGLYVDFPIGTEVYRVETTDGMCIIPDELLQTSGGHKVYECMTNNTIRSFAFSVTPRPKPPDYVYTPTERLTFEGLVQKVDDAVADMIRRAESGEFDGYTPVKGKDYFTTAEIQQIQNEVSSGAIEEFKSVVDTETETFNNNAETKLIAYNQNDSEKTASYNANATKKLNAYNTNANNRLAEFDAHTEQIQTDVSELKSDLGEFTKKEIGTNLLPPDTECGTYNLTTGEKENNSSIVRTPNKTKIPIGLSSINIMINKPCNRYLAMLFYKADGAYLGYKTVDLEGKTQATFNVFDGSEYITIWIGDSTYSFDNVCVYSGSLISEFQPYESKTVVVKDGLEDDLIEKLNNIDETLYNKNLFSGKTIVNFGDSIFGNNDSDTSTSNEIAKHLKATVLNCGFGGTRMSDSRGSNREWSNFDAPNLINAVVNGDFSAQENAISQGLPGGTPGYFAPRLRDLKAINFNGVDIITLNQGTNDYTSGVAIDNNGNLEDLSKYKGAIRYIVKKILSKYPHIDIFLVSPTWRYWKKSDGSLDYDSNEYKVGGTELHNLRDYVVAMREVAEELNIKFIDCYNIGINKYNCSMYFPSDDGTHHNEFGRAKLGEHIARQLLSN